MGFFNKISQYINGWFEKLTGEQKRRLILVCTGVFAAILTLAVIISLIKPRQGSLPSGMEKMKLNYAIPAEELFLPDEPEFLPDVILERGRRTSWTEDDAALYWQDPLREGEQQWRDKIEAVVDKFLERVQ